MTVALTKYVPNLASLGGNFTTGPASGTPRIVEPSAGDQAAGYIPGADADAQSVNFYVNAIGAHLEAVVDAPSFEWRPLSSYANADFQQATLNPDANPNGVSDPPLFTKAVDGYIYAQGFNGSVGAGHYSSIRHKFGRGFQFAGESTSATESISSQTANANQIPGTDGRVITLAGTGTTQIARFVYIGSGTDLLRHQYSNDNGVTWSSFTTIVSVASSELFAAFQWNGAWYVGIKSGPGPYSTTFYKSSSLDLATATWASSFFCSNAAAAADFIARRAAGSSSIVVIVPEQDNTLTAWDGTTRTNIAIASHAVVTGWRIAYNATIGLFGLVNLQGDFWTSPDGINWTLAHAFGGALVANDIAAHGRGFLVANGGDYVSFLALDHTQAWSLRVVLEAYLVNPGNAFHLVAVRGAVIAARTVYDGSNWRTEWYRSNVHPLDRVLT